MLHWGWRGGGGGSAVNEYVKNAKRGYTESYVNVYVTSMKASMNDLKNTSANSFSKNLRVMGFLKKTI